MSKAKAKRNPVVKRRVAAVASPCPSAPVAVPPALADPRPAPRFQPGDMVRTSIEVCEAQVAKIVGRFWGPDEKRRPCDGWFYMLQFFIADPRPGVSHVWPTNKTFTATEEELVKWRESQ